MKKGLPALVLTLFCMSGASYAQLARAMTDSRLDSLRKAINDPATHDTTASAMLEDLAAYFRVVNFDSAEHYGQVALERARRHQRWRQEVIALQSLVTTLLHRKQFAKAYALNLSSQKLSEDHQYAKGYRAALINSGTIYRMSGNYQAALQYYLDVLKNLGGEDQKMQAMCHFYIGIVYANLKDPKNSIAHYNQSLALSETLKLDEYVAANLVNLYFITEESDDPMKAIRYLDKALTIYEKHNNLVGKSTVLQNYGYIYFKKGDLEKAMAFARQCLDLREKINSQSGLKDVHQLLSLIYRARKQYDKAIASDNITLALATKYHDVSDLVQANEHLSLCYSDLGNFEKALFYANERTHWKDSLLSFEKFSKINQMETAHAIEREKAKADQLEQEKILQAEIMRQQTWKIWYLALLLVLLALGSGLLFLRFRQKLKWAARLEQKNHTIEKQNTAIKEQNVLIESINHELHDRALRAQMNPHFIFNALTSIQYMVVSGKLDEAFEYLSKFSALLRKVLDHSDKQRINIADEVEMLRLYVALESLRFNDGFDCAIGVSLQDNLENQNFIPPMTVQPFVENAIIHGLLPKQTGDRRLEIKFMQQETNVICQITDNGIGRAAAQKIRSERKVWHESKGVRIARNRINVLNRLSSADSGFSVEDLTDEHGMPLGTRVTLQFGYGN